MTNLSSIPGFSSGGGAGGGYTGTALTDTYKTLLASPDYTLDSIPVLYNSSAVRIRSFDTSTEAFFGFHHQAIETTSGNKWFHDVFTLFSANQSTGEITEKGTIAVDTNTFNNASTNQSTDRAADEWTGRHMLHGYLFNSHTTNGYSGYNSTLITWDEANQQLGKYNSVATSSNTSGNHYSSSRQYVAPNQRIAGGDVKHLVNAYNSSYKGAPQEFVLAGTSSATPANVGIAFTSTLAATNHYVPLHYQFDATTEPYYDAFHSINEGVIARVRTTGSWSIVIPYKGTATASTSASRLISAWALSTGTMLVSFLDETYLIDTSGVVTEIDWQLILGLKTKNQSYGTHPTVVNIGTDEWLVIHPQGEFSKFKINTTTGVVTSSNMVRDDTCYNMSLCLKAKQKYGLEPGLTLSNVSNCGDWFTFGAENNADPGKGRSKLCWLGAADYEDGGIYMQTYDLTDLTAALTYP